MVRKSNVAPRRIMVNHGSVKAFDKNEEIKEQPFEQIEYHHPVFRHTVADLGGQPLPSCDSFSNDRNTNNVSLQWKQKDSFRKCRVL